MFQNICMSLCTLWHQSFGSYSMHSMVFRTTYPNTYWYSWLITISSFQIILKNSLESYIFWCLMCMFYKCRHTTTLYLHPSLLTSILVKLMEYDLRRSSKCKFMWTDAETHLLLTHVPSQISAGITQWNILLPVADLLFWWKWTAYGSWYGLQREVAELWQVRSTMISASKGP